MNKQTIEFTENLSAFLLYLGCSGILFAIWFANINISFKLLLTSLISIGLSFVFNEVVKGNEVKK